MDDQPKTLILPRELPPTTPVHTFQDRPAPKTMPVPARVISEEVVVLDDGCGMGGMMGQWLAGIRAQQLYGSAEVLFWTARGANIPPLVTTASPTDPEATRAALGFGTTRTLLGPGNTLEGIRPGARFTVGYNFDPCGLCAIEGSFFFLSRKNDAHVFDSSSTPVIGRPFFNLNTGTQDRELTTSPGTSPGDVFAGTGTLAIQQSTTLFGAELNHRRLCWCGDDWRVTGLVGFRYLDLSDSLRMDENITIQRDIPGAPNAPPIARAGDQVFVFDNFDTSNRFYGGQIGFTGERQIGRFVLGGTAKLAIGATVQTVDMDGGQRITSVGGSVQTFTGGLYALPTNIGHHSQTRFALVPEFGVKLGYQVTDNVRVFVGCDFLYWSSVLRPGDQIDQGLDANLIPNSGAPFPPTTQRRPAVLFQTSSYWAYGVNAGMEIRY
jgi:hypothetical protein